MNNYYEQLGIDQELQGEELNKALKQLRKKLVMRMNAPDLQKRQEAERMMQLVDEATLILCDKDKRHKYDKELKKKKNQGTQNAYQEQAAAATQVAENAVETLISLAEDMYSAGNYQGAIDTCHKVLGMGITNSRVYYVLGMTYMDLNNVNEALKVFQNAVAQNPDDQDMILYLAKLCVLMDRADEAEKYANIVLSKNADNTYGQAILIEIELVRKKYDVAVKLFEETKNKYPNDQKFLNSVSDAYVRTAHRLLYTAPNGANYLNSKDDVEQYMIFMQKAVDISPTPYALQALENAKKQKKKHMDTEDQLGFKAVIGTITADLFFTIFFEMPIELAIIILVPCIVVLYFNYKEEWRINKKILTNKKEPIDYVLRIVGVLGLAALLFIKVVFKMVEYGLRAATDR